LISNRREQEIVMPEYIPSPRQWVRDQVELYEKSGGTEGTTLRDTGLPVIIVTHRGNKSGAIRKTPLMKVKEGVDVDYAPRGRSACARGRRRARPRPAAVDPPAPPNSERAISRGIELGAAATFPCVLNPLAAGVPAPAGVSSSPSAPTPAPGSE
jgi:F420H(2)-dependent quinone reductase